MLQDINIPAWQENQMHVIEVDDLDLYWAENDALDLPDKYAGVRTNRQPITPGAGKSTSSIPAASAGTSGRVRRPADNRAALLTADPVCRMALAILTPPDPRTEP